MRLGVIINPNDLGDSGLLISGGVGYGLEMSVKTPLPEELAEIEQAQAMFDTLLPVMTNAADLTLPTSTLQLEGKSTKIVGSAGFGASFNDKGVAQGVEVLAVGGGVYYTETKVHTINEAIENIDKFGEFIIESIFGINNVIIGNFK